MRVLQLIDLQKGINGEIESENYQRLKRITHYAEFFIKPEESEFRGYQSREILSKAKAILEAEDALIRKLTFGDRNFIFYKKILATPHLMKN